MPHTDPDEYRQTISDITIGVLSPDETVYIEASTRGIQLDLAYDTYRDHSEESISEQIEQSIIKAMEEFDREKKRTEIEQLGVPPKDEFKLSPKGRMWAQIGEEISKFKDNYTTANKNIHIEWDDEDVLIAIRPGTKNRLTYSKLVNALQEAIDEIIAKRAKYVDCRANLRLGIS